MQVSGNEVVRKPTLTRRALLGLGMAILSAGLFLGAGGAPPQAQGLEGIEVRFSQLNWLGGKGKAARFPQSRVGVAEFTFRPEAAPALIGQGGFVNVVIQVPAGKREEWAVRNLYLRYKNERFLFGSQPSVQFNLTTPNGKRVRRLGYRMTLTPQPLSAPPSGRFLPALVSLENYRVGGLFGAGSEVADTPLRIKAWGSLLNDNDIVITEEVTTLVPVADLPEVNEDPNGCAPASVARSIRYMLENAGAEEPDSAQSIYEDLYESMETDPEDGTEIDNIVSGKQAYSDANGLDIDTSLTDGIGDIGDAMDVLGSGGDVEILIFWDDPGDGPGGHAAMIVSIVDLGNGSYQITYVDDADQEDGQPSNDTHVIVVGPDGSFDGGSVGGLLIETMPGAGQPDTPVTPTPNPTPTPGTFLPIPPG